MEGREKQTKNEQRRRGTTVTAAAVILATSKKTNVGALRCTTNDEDGGVYAVFFGVAVVQDREDQRRGRRGMSVG
jgi:hypothetical protein